MNEARRPEDRSARAPSISARMTVPIREEADVAVARSSTSALAISAGFPAGAVGAVTIAASEVARNILVHAGAGEIVLELVEDGGRPGIAVVARDEHPGIADVGLAMRDGYSTGSGLGLGLSSAKRLMDEFTIESALGHGTVVTMRKWQHGAND